MERFIHVEHGFGPCYAADSTRLFLGTMASPKSREAGFFYMHPRNRFWPVMATLDGSLLDTTAQRVAFLHRRHFALWDVIASCDIIGSSDSSIKNVVANDIGRVLSEASIRQIFVNGQTAFKLYKKYVLPETGVMPVCLPSTSPANAAWNMERLTEAWQVIVRES